ncbi:MAG: TonB-dependent receptor plug domain-containing protein [Longimicrobiales bacterium]
MTLAAALIAGCSTNSQGGRGGDADGPGQLITSKMIRDSRLSNGWDVLRRYARHLSFSEHERGPVRITRRGRESIYLNESPLLLIDGVKVQDFRTLVSLPARDIESIRILSGAESSVHHGIFAASGAIVVRTIHPDPYPQPDPLPQDTAAKPIRT